MQELRNVQIKAKHSVIFSNLKYSDLKIRKRKKMTPLGEGKRTVKSNFDETISYNPSPFLKICTYFHKDYFMGSYSF